ncbi:MAG: PhoH family protein, partial [Actinomycetota bacterium]
MKILVPGDQTMVALLGQQDELLKIIEAAFESQILVRGNEITISGEAAETERLGSLFEDLLRLLDRGQELTPTSVTRSIDIIERDGVRPSDVMQEVLLTSRGKAITPKTVG